MIRSIWCWFKWKVEQALVLLGLKLPQDWIVYRAMVKNLGRQRAAEIYEDGVDIRERIGNWRWCREEMLNATWEVDNESNV